MIFDELSFFQELKVPTRGKFYFASHSHSFISAITALFYPDVKEEGLNDILTLFLCFSYLQAVLRKNINEKRR